MKIPSTSLQIYNRQNSEYVSPMDSYKIGGINSNTLEVEYVPRCGNWTPTVKHGSSFVKRVPCH